MREGGATKSVVGGSVSSKSSRSRSRCQSVRSQSVLSHATGITQMSEDWDIDQEISKMNLQPRKLPTHRGRAKLDLKNKGPKPLVQRPGINKQDQILPAPSPSAFRHDTHVTSNQSEYKLLAPISQAQNQGPTRAKGRRRESSRPFTKQCENAVNTSAITGSKVFAQRVAAR